MRQYPSDIAFTPAVKGIQTAKGSRASYAKVERRGWRTHVTPDLAEFLAGLDMFYLGTATPRGSPTFSTGADQPGFLKVLDDGRWASPTSAATASTSRSATCRRTPKRSSS